MATPLQSLELTPRGRVALALATVSLLGAWLSGDPNVRIAAALLLAPIAVDFVRKPRGLRAIAVHVNPRRTIAGAPFGERLTLHNAGGRPVREVRIAEPSTRGRPTLLPELGADARGTAVVHCLAPDRGHPLQRVFHLSSEWPLGLFRVHALAVSPTDLVVEPRRVHLDAATVHSAAPRSTSSRTSRQLVGDDFHALREHQLDEDARGVHALRSAAVGSLVRTERRGRLPQQIGIVLDLRRPPGRPLQLGRRRLEWSLGACATLIDALAGETATLEVVVVGSRTVTLRIQDAKKARELLTLLAEVAVGPHRALEPHALDGLRALEHCFWIPAGGYLSHTETDRCGLAVQVLGGGDD